MKHFSAFKIVITAMFAALVCVATMVVQIPIAATGGYANLGDGIVLVAAVLMHPLYAVLAAGLGSMLADLLAGYAVYAPATLLIKAGVALIATLIFNRFGRGKRGGKALPVMLVSAIAAEMLMVLGYFFYEAVILQYGLAAAAAIPANIGQGAVGIVVACVVAPVMQNNGEVKNLMNKTWK